MTPRAYAGIVGIVCLVAAVGLALWPSSLAGGTDCGSMLFPRSDGSLTDRVGQLAESLCQSALDGRAVWVFVLAGLGALIIVGALLVRPAAAQARNES